MDRLTHLREWCRHHWLALAVLIVSALTAGLLLMLPDLEMHSSQVSAVSAISLALSLTRVAVAAATAFIVLRVLDVALAIHTAPVIERIEYDAQASATYMGLRFVGVCLLVGLVL